MPVPDEIRKQYPQDDWLTDWEYWSARAPIRPSHTSVMVIYFFERYPENPRKTTNMVRLHTALMFFEAHIDDFVRTGVIQRDKKGAVSLPLAFLTALYRAYMSFDTAILATAVTV